MSVHKFKLKEEHIKLIKQFNITDGDGVPFINNKEPFGNNDVYEDIDLILNGKIKDVGPDDVWDDVYSDEQKTEWNNLLKELTTALDIILFTGKFEVGNYMTRTYERNWKKL